MGALNGLHLLLMTLMMLLLHSNELTMMPMLALHKHSNVLLLNPHRCNQVNRNCCKDFA